MIWREVKNTLNSYKLILRELKEEAKYMFLGSIYLYCENCGKTTVIDGKRRKELGVNWISHEKLKFLRCESCGTPYGKNFYPYDPLKG